MHCGRQERVVTVRVQRREPEPETLGLSEMNVSRPGSGSRNRELLKEHVAIEDVRDEVDTERRRSDLDAEAIAYSSNDLTDAFRRRCRRVEYGAQGALRTWCTICT